MSAARTWPGRIAVLVHAVVLARAAVLEHAALFARATVRARSAAIARTVAAVVAACRTRFPVAVAWRSRSAAVRAGSLLLIAGITWLSNGCGRPADLQSSSSSSSAMFATGATQRPFLQKIPDAPMNTAYGGTRHVTFNYQVNDVPATVEYTEQVYADGTGQFTVIPLEVIQPSMNAQAVDLFKLLQMHREGFMYRHRDFRVRDLDLFQQNYAVSDLGPSITVCGRQCVWLDVRRQTDPQSYDHIAVDPANGLILRCEEYAITGELEASVEFTQFTLTPDLTNVQFHTELMSPQTLDLGTDTVAQIGFTVHVPTLLPHEFQLESAEKINDGTQNWARLAFSDGAQQVFFVYSVDPAPPQQATSGGGTHHPQRLVHVFHFGPWIVAQGDFDDEHLIAVGKTEESALLQMIQSALH